jgi:hypothetical protein
LIFTGFQLSTWNTLYSSLHWGPPAIHAVFPILMPGLLLNRDPSLSAASSFAVRAEPK